MQTTVDTRSKAYTEGFMVGLKHESQTKYGYSNPYDRRKQTGKDWELGKAAGVEFRCLHGVEFASQELARLKELMA